MGLAHYIAESFREVMAVSDNWDPPALPGGIYYGARGEMETPVYPLGRLEIREDEREYNSGGGSLVTYEVRLTVYSQAGQQYAAEIVRQFAAYVHTYNLRWEALPATLGSLISMIPTAGTMDEDPDDEFGQDTDRASITWTVMLSEREAITA